MHLNNNKPNKRKDSGKKKDHSSSKLELITTKDKQINIEEATVEVETTITIEVVMKVAMNKEAAEVVQP